MGLKRGVSGVVQAIPLLRADRLVVVRREAAVDEVGGEGNLNSLAVERIDRSTGRCEARLETSKALDERLSSSSTLALAIGGQLALVLFVLMLKTEREKWLKAAGIEALACLSEVVVDEAQFGSRSGPAIAGRPNRCGSCRTCAESWPRPVRADAPLRRSGA